MELIVVSPTQNNTYAIAWIEISTPAGSFVVQHGHMPMIIALKENTSLPFRLENGKQEVIVVPQGIAEITRSSVTIIINESML